MRAGLLAIIEWNLTLAMPSSIFSSNFQSPLSTAMVSGVRLRCPTWHLSLRLFATPGIERCSRSSAAPHAEP